MAHAAPVPAAYALPDATTIQDVPKVPAAIAVSDAASSAATAQPAGRASTPLWQPSPTAPTPVPSSTAYVLPSTTVVDGYVAVTLPGHEPNRYVPDKHWDACRQLAHTRFVTRVQGLVWYCVAVHSVHAVHAGLDVFVHWPRRYCVTEHCCAVAHDAHDGDVVVVQDPVRYEPPEHDVRQFWQTRLVETVHEVVSNWDPLHDAHCTHVGVVVCVQVPER